MKKTELTISYRTLIRIVLAVALVAFAFSFVRKVEHALTLIFISAFLTLSLNPLVNWMNKRFKQLSRVKATAVSYSLVLLVLGGFLYMTIPPLVTQTVGFIENVPTIIKDFTTQDSALARLAKRSHVTEQLNSISQDWASHVADLRAPALHAAGQVGSSIVSFLTVIVLTFMMLAEGPDIVAFLWTLRDEKNRAREKALVQKMYGTVTGFVNGQVILASIAALCAMSMLFIGRQVFHAHVNPVALAGIVLLCGIIPMIGNPLSSSLVIVACLFSSLNLALFMGVYFVVYFQIENITLLPYIQSRQNELTPMIVFIAALMGIGFGGLLGGLIAIPAASCIKILLEDRFSRQRELATTDSRA
jgi:predicted PurR-regulated permease PerM